MSPRVLPTVAVLCCAVAARATIVSFQQGTAGYIRCFDTYLSESEPNSAHGNSEAAEWDGDDPPGTGQQNIGLIRFDEIFGLAPGQVPPGSSITAATLTYTVFNTGDPGNLHECGISWSESVTYAAFGGGGGIQPSNLGAYVVSASGLVLGTTNVDVTQSLCRWTVNPSANKGWMILPTGTNGVGFRSSEYVLDPAQRPILTVEFGPPAAPALLRRPYLQMGTDRSMTIAWRTDVCTNSVVHFGTALGSLTSVLTDSAGVLDHAITLTGLSPRTRYYYNVGTTTQVLAGGDAEHYFVTSPEPGRSTSFTAWIVGDSGTGDLNQAAVRDAMLAHTASDLPDIFLHLGDMAYYSGTDPEFSAGFFTPYQDILRHTVCWPTLGNHEGVSASSATQSGPYYQSYVLPTAGQAGGLQTGTEAYYSFDYANAHFICLDSHDTSRLPGSPMLTWVAADIAATEQQWVIAFWHHPPYSKGSHDSDDILDSGGRLRDMRENVLPILEAGGVDLVLAGHSHIYERSWLVDGAYDTPTTAAGHIVDAGDGRPGGDGAYLKTTGQNAHQGAVYVVAGHGGAPLGGTGGHPLMYFTELALGSCLLTIDGNVLSMKNLRADGAVTDTFTIIKPPQGDLDSDGDVDEVDLPGFVNVLLDLDTDPARIARCDMNYDTVTNSTDVAYFTFALLED
jgi:hypothetical protein